MQVFKPATTADLKVRHYESQGELD